MGRLMNRTLREQEEEHALLGSKERYVPWFNVERLKYNTLGIYHGEAHNRETNKTVGRFQ